MMMLSGVFKQKRAMEALSARAGNVTPPEKTAAEKAFEALATEAIDLDVLERDEVTLLVLQGGTWEEQYTRLRDAVGTRLDDLTAAMGTLKTCLLGGA